MRSKSKKNTVTYQLTLHSEAGDKVFTDDEKQLLRPVAEVLAMLDGNAFFGADLGDGREWYEQYLPEAWSLFEANGGITGWPSGMSWVRDMNNDHPAVIEARRSFRIALELSK